jgi:protein-S-isoprenylcysteine O-methyltransferase Ste14
MKIIRQMISFSLPVTVLILIPFLIERDFKPSGQPAVVLGSILILLSLVIITLTVRTFIRIGKGTLAPWDPTRRLVTASLYGYVRNPMILGVFCGLVGETILFSSIKLSIWAVSFFPTLARVCNACGF